MTTERDEVTPTAEDEEAASEFWQRSYGQDCDPHPNDLLLLAIFRARARAEGERAGLERAAKWHEDAAKDAWKQRSTPPSGDYIAALWLAECVRQNDSHRAHASQIRALIERGDYCRDCARCPCCGAEGHCRCNIYDFEGYSNETGPWSEKRCTEHKQRLGRSNG